MDFIYSQKIKEKLTHMLSKKEDYKIMTNDGIKIFKRTNEMMWKPNCFWISMDSDWEKWCYGNDFRNAPEYYIVDIILKENLKLLKITNVNQAEELAQYILPDIQHTYGWIKNKSDMSYMTICHFELVKQNKPSGPDIWKGIEKEYDGIYYRNSYALHSETFFNTWDAHCIALFDGNNASVTNLRSCKEIKFNED